MLIFSKSDCGLKYSLKLFNGDQPHGAALVVKGMHGTYALMDTTMHVDTEIEMTSVSDVFPERPLEISDGEVVECAYFIMKFQYHSYRDFELGYTESEFDFESCVSVTAEQFNAHMNGTAKLWEEFGLNGLDNEDELSV